jgi:hypothetical protein
MRTVDVAEMSALPVSRPKEMNGVYVVVGVAVTVT